MTDRVGELCRLVRDLVCGALETDLDGGDLLLKEAWEACEDDDERAIVRDEIRRIQRELGVASASHCPIVESACPVHGVYHGREAEYLRSGMEEIYADVPYLDPLDGSDLAHALRDVLISLRVLLDRVDQTGGLACVESESRSA